MKSKALMAATVLTVLFLFTGVLYALSNGNLIVDGNLGVGTTSEPQNRAEIGGNMVVDGNVGIGIATPGEKLSVSGTIESTSGGFKFPDGSIQTTAKRLVWDGTVTSAITSTTSPVLDGNAAGGYEFEFWIYSNGSPDIRMYYNNDRVDTNYDSSAVYGDTRKTAYATYHNDAYLTYTTPNSWHLVSGTISINPIGLINADYLQSDRSSSYKTIRAKTHQYRNPVTNLNQIDIVASIGSGIGANSRFRLWKKNW